MMPAISPVAPPLKIGRLPPVRSHSAVFARAFEAQAPHRPSDNTYAIRAGGREFTRVDEVVDEAVAHWIAAGVSPGEVLSAFCRQYKPLVPVPSDPSWTTTMGYLAEWQRRYDRGEFKREYTGGDLR